MNEIMKILLSLSLSGTLLLLFILSLKLLYKNKFSRRWQYYVWIIVAFRFLFPFSFGTTVVGSMFERFGTAKITDETTVSQKKPVLLKEGAENETEPSHATMNEYESEKTLPALNGSESDELQPMVNENEAGQTQSEINEKETGQTQLGKNENDTGRTWFKMNHGTEQAWPPSETKKSIVYLFSVWLILTLILLVRKITIYQGFIRYIRIGNIEVSDIKTLNLLSDCREKLNIRTKIEIYRNPLIISPMMVGFFRPYIILPDGEFKDRELSYIFMHELIHCKQKDMFYKWLIQIVVCLHWFNPFVYLLEKEVNKACELSCDEKVISALDDEERREYGDTLISFMKEVNPYKNSLASVTMSEGAEQIKERLGAIMNYKKKSKIIITVTAILSVAFIFCFFEVGAYAANDKEALKYGKTLKEINITAIETAALICKNAENPDKVTPSSVSFPSISRKKENKDLIYIYDEETGIGYYKGEDWEDWDWDWDDWKEEDWDWDDEDWDWDWDDKDLIREYASHGIEKKGKSYYYKGELVKIIKDQRPDSSFYMLDINSKGTACIKVVRNKKNKITGVSYMTEKEKEKLLKRAAPEPDKLPVTDKIPVINTTKWDVSGILTVDARYKADNVYILPSPDNHIILKEYITEHKPDYCANTKIKNNVLTIRSGKRPKKSYSSYIEIYIPDGALDNVKVKTVSGAITATNLKSMAALSSVSGAIDISDSEVEGNISTVSGGINISGSGVKGNISTVSGGIKLFPSAVSGDLRVNSHSGNIAAHFPDSTGYKLKADTYTGNIKGSLFNTKSRNEKNVSRIFGNNPKFTILLETFSGNIRVD